MCEQDIPANHPLHCGQDNKSSGAVWAAARSQHNNGVNVMMCDASVHFIPDSVDLGVWRAMATRAGIEQNQLPW